jgi:hypothetical protein
MAEQPSEKPSRREHQEENRHHEHWSRHFGDRRREGHPSPVNRPQPGCRDEPRGDQRASQDQANPRRGEVGTSPKERSEHEKRPTYQETELTPLGLSQSS